MMIGKFLPIKQVVYLGIIFFAYSVLVQGCTTIPKGELFNPISDMKPEELIVYIYWPEAAKTKSDFTIKANGTLLGTISPGSYIPYRSTDREVILEANLQFKPMVAGLLDVGMAKTTQIKIDIGLDRDPVFVECYPYSDTKGMNMSMPGLINQLGMKTVLPTNAKYVISKCRLLR